MKPPLLLIFLFFVVLGCAKKKSLDARFMRDNTCYVYKREIINERHQGYTLSYLSKQSTNTCAKRSLKHVMILHFKNDSETLIRAKKPRRYIQFLEKCKKEIESDSIRILRLEAKGVHVNLTLGKRFLNSNDSVFNQQYVPYASLHFQKRNKRWDRDSLSYNPNYPLKRPIIND